MVQEVEQEEAGRAQGPVWSPIFLVAWASSAHKYILTTNSEYFRQSGGMENGIYTAEGLLWKRSSSLLYTHANSSALKMLQSLK